MYMQKQYLSRMDTMGGNCYNCYTMWGNCYNCYTMGSNCYTMGCNCYNCYTMGGNCYVVAHELCMENRNQGVTVISLRRYYIRKIETRGDCYAVISGTGFVDGDKEETQVCMHACVGMCTSKYKKETQVCMHVWVCVRQNIRKRLRYVCMCGYVYVKI